MLKCEFCEYTTDKYRVLCRHMDVMHDGHEGSDLEHNKVNVLIQYEKTLQAVEATKQKELDMKMKEIDERMMPGLARQKELDIMKLELELKIHNLKWLQG